MAWKVIDVSRYQGTIDWDKVKGDGVQGAMLKTVSTNSSYGGIYIDPQFERNYAECKRLGIPVGVYYYTYAQNTAKANAELVKLKEAIAGKTFEMPIVCDVEENKLKPLSKAALTDLVEMALQTIQSWGCYAMLYTYTYYQQTELDMNRLAKYALWIADYRGKRPAIEHGMWQYSSSGTVAGIAGRCDMNHCYKDYPAIIKKAGLNGFSKTAASTDQKQETATQYGVKDFVKEVQAATGAEIDGIAGRETLANTVTVSAKINRKHRVVKPIQRRLNALGFDCGKVDGIAGSKFTSAVKAFQRENGCVSDGIISARNTTWKKLLGMA